jgi:cytochrome c6
VVPIFWYFRGVFIGKSNSLAGNNLIRCLEELVKKFLSAWLVAIALFTTLWVNPVLADASTDAIAQGAKVFNANCAACHMNGNNVVNAGKNLKSATLKQYSMDSEAAIVTQVTNGKGAMPSFKAKLNEDQIHAVAAYVLDQSAKDWKKG